MSKRFFNTAGVTNPVDHYFLPHRLNWKELKSFIEKKHYFVLHAPRQSGKTTAILEWAQELNREGKYKAFYINVEAVQASRGRVEEGMRTLLHCFRSGILHYFGEKDPVITYINQEIDKKNFSGNTLQELLQVWSKTTWEREHKSLVLFIDEIDALVGDTLISVLRQLRAGYANRPGAFPQSVCLFGVRDVRDYRIWSDQEQATILGGSAFNIKAESIVLPNFSEEDVKTLYEQHTQETGQLFTSEALAYAFEQTRGQPWLVNALAYQACFRDVEDRSIPITKEILEQAKESLIKRCDTHIDVLLDRLQEPRVRDIIDAILSGDGEDQEFPADDLQYVQDLGLIASQGLVIANPIYQEVIPRALASAKQRSIVQELAWYQKKDGSLDIPELLKGFTAFYRENSEVWLEKFSYKESGPHLLLLAFLQRIINGGGKIHREYALGRKRVDLSITWKQQKIVIELKVQKSKQDLPSWLQQTADYMDRAGATEGYLVIFDRDAGKSWEEKIYQKQESFQGKAIQVFGM